MANYNNNFITYDAYQVMQMHGLQYEGFIKGVGYAYTSDIAIAPDHMSGNGSPFAEPGLDQYMQGTVQWIDTSKEAIARSYNITEEEIKRKIAKAKENFGIVTVNLGFNRSVDLPLHDNVIDVRINSDGIEQTVSISATNGITGESYSTQYKVVDLPLVYENSGLLDNYNGDVGKVASSQGDDNMYGKTIKERALNPKFWFDAVTASGEFELGNNVQQISFADNPVSWVIPFSSVPKASLGITVVKNASKNTLLTSSFLQEIGVRGFVGKKIWTPFGKASTWQTILGRWWGTLTTPFLIHDTIKDEIGDENKR